MMLARPHFLSPDVPTYHRDSFQALVHTSSVLPGLRYRAPHTHGGDAIVLLRFLLRVRVARRYLVHGPGQLHFTQQQEADVAGHAWVAVIGRLGRDVSQVDALAECVAVYGSLRRSDAQALRENATKVGSSGSVPQQAPVLVLELREFGRLEPIVLALALDAEDVLQPVPEIMGLAGRLNQVFGQLAVLLGVVLQGRHLFHAEVFEAFVV